MVLNPAPAQPLGAALLRLIDVITPNETEAEILTGASGERGGGVTLHGRGGVGWRGCSCDWRFDFV